MEMAQNGSASTMQTPTSNCSTTSHSACSRSSRVVSYRGVPRGIGSSNNSFASISIQNPFVFGFPSFKKHSLQEINNTSPGVSLQAAALSTPINDRIIERLVLILYGLLLALVLHISNYYYEFGEIIELQYRNFPILVLLAVFHTTVHRRNVLNKPEELLRLSTHVSCTSGETLNEIEQYYNVCDLRGEEYDDILSPPRITSTCIHSTDEWGHFADFEENKEIRDYAPDLAQSCSRDSQSSLMEIKMQAISQNSPMRIP